MCCGRLLCKTSWRATPALRNYVSRLYPVVTPLIRGARGVRNRMSRTYRIMLAPLLKPPTIPLIRGTSKQYRSGRSPPYATYIKPF